MICIIIQIPDRRKQWQLCHIDMLKPYFDNDSVSSHSVNVVYSVPFEIIDCKIQTEDEHFVKSDPGLAKLQNSDIMKNLEISHLESLQKYELSKLIWEYKLLFSDVPTITNKMYHDVDAGKSLPIKQHPYRMNTIKKKYLKEEIQYLLDNNFIQTSKSAWSFTMHSRVKTSQVLPVVYRL